MFISNNRPSSQLWSKKNLVKHQRNSKYYENDCSLPQKLARHSHQPRYHASRSRTSPAPSTLAYHPHKYVTHATHAKTSSTPLLKLASSSKKLSFSKL